VPCRARVEKDAGIGSRARQARRAADAGVNVDGARHEVTGAARRDCCYAVADSLFGSFQFGRTKWHV
jgi:hypothetical protein